MVSKPKNSPMSLVKLPDTMDGMIESIATIMIGEAGLCLRSTVYTARIG